MRRVALVRHGIYQRYRLQLELTSTLTPDDFDPKISTMPTISTADWLADETCTCIEGCGLECSCRKQEAHCNSACACWDSQRHCGNPYTQITDLFNGRHAFSHARSIVGECTQYHMRVVERVDFGKLYGRLFGHPSAEEAFRLDPNLRKVESLLKDSARANRESINHENLKRALVRYAIGSKTDNAGRADDSVPEHNEYAWSFCNGAWVAKKLMIHCGACDRCVPRAAWLSCGDDFMSDEEQKRAEETYRAGPTWERKQMILDPDDGSGEEEETGNVTRHSWIRRPRS